MQLNPFVTMDSVAKAIAPFAAVSSNLKVVVDKQETALVAANDRLAAARLMYQTAEARENSNISAAESEIAAAKNIIDKLDAFLSDVK